MKALQIKSKQWTAHMRPIKMIIGSCRSFVTLDSLREWPRKEGCLSVNYLFIGSQLGPLQSLRERKNVSQCLTLKQCIYSPVIVLHRYADISFKGTLCTKGYVLPPCVGLKKRISVFWLSRGVQKPFLACFDTLGPREGTNKACGVSDNYVVSMFVKIPVVSEI